MVTKLLHIFHLRAPLPSVITLEVPKQTSVEQSGKLVTDTL